MKNGPYIIATFYKITPFLRCGDFQLPLKTEMQAHDVRGTILVTPEGINGTISGRRENIDHILSYLRAQPEFTDLTHKESAADSHVFERVKVKHKKEVISLGRPVNALHNPGTYLKPADWHRLISDPDTIVIDTRNDYEVDFGSFKNALNPEIKNFRELPEYLDKNLKDKSRKVAMFCTGGIRCEKSTAYLKEQGFENVYHLEGGILKYLEEIPQDASLWEGNCYVFDERIAVDHGLRTVPDADKCPSCHTQLTTNDRQKPGHIPGQRCRYCPSPAHSAPEGEHAAG